jgi:hypothetical protein
MFRYDKFIFVMYCYKYHTQSEAGVECLEELSSRLSSSNLTLLFLLRFLRFVPRCCCFFGAFLANSKYNSFWASFIRRQSSAPIFISWLPPRLRLHFLKSRKKFRKGFLEGGGLLPDLLSFRFSTKSLMAKSLLQHKF